MPGKATEDWPLNLIDLDREEHQRGHVQGWQYEELWEKRRYTQEELLLLALLGELPEATRYPLVRERAFWARGKLGLLEGARFVTTARRVKVLPSTLLVMARKLDSARPIPGWIKHALEGRP
jgi:hypothetical protein